MNVAGRKQASSRVTVTQERNAPVKPGKLTFNPVHAAYGNGYADAVANQDRAPEPPVKFVGEAAKPQMPVQPPVNLITLPEVTIIGRVPDKLADGQNAEPGRLPKQTPQALWQGKESAKPPATVGTDGAMVFNADAVKDRIVGTPPAPGQQIAGDDPLTKLAPDAAQASPKDGKADDLDAKTKRAMTRPAGADTAAGEDSEDKAAAEKKSPDNGKPLFGKDAKQAAPVKDDPGQTAVQSDTGAGGGGGADLAAWKSKVSGAIAATPKPTLGDGAGSSITVMSATAKGAAGRYRGGGGGAAKDVKKAVRPPPVTPKPLPPMPPTVVPAADQAIAAASDKKLPDQELPLLKQPPKEVFENATAPVMDVALGEDLGSSIALPEPPKSDVPGGKEPADAKARKKLKEAKEKEPEPKQGMPGQKMVLKDTAPPITPRPERGTKGQSKETFRLVLGEMLRKPGPDGEATAITDEARDEAYPGKAVSREYLTMGAEWKDPIKAELEAQVKAIADMAGITQAEMAGAVADRQAQLDAMEKGEKAKIDTAGKDAKEDTKKGGEDAAADIWGARLAQDEDTIKKLIAANGESDPQVIQMRRDMGVRDLTRRAARQDVNYEKAGDRRTRALDAAHAKMQNAYKKAGQGDEKKVYDEIKKTELAARKPEKGKKADKAAIEKTDQEASAIADAGAKARTKALWEWVRVEVEALKTRFGELKDAVVKTTKSYRDGITSALDRAKTLLDNWADERLEAQESWWESLVREFRQWAKDAQSDSAAWEEARNEQLRDAVAGDLQLIADLEGAMRQRVDMKAFIQERGLDAAQFKVVQKFFKPVGPEGKQQFDSIGAVAEGMRARVRTNRKPGMIERFKQEVLSRPNSEWDKLGFIGNAERPPFSVSDLASKLFHAMDQWGTEEKDIFAALSNLTPLQAKAVRACYATLYSPRRGGRSLDADLAYEMDDEELDRAKAQLEGNQALADAAALAEAMDGPGTDEPEIMAVLRNKTPEQQAAIKAEYKRQYGRDLDADLKSELDDGFSSHHDLDRAKALRANNVALADAIGLDAAMHGGIFGAGTEEGEITAIYEQNRREVEAEASQKGWTTAEIQAEVVKRNQAIDGAYEGKYGDPAARAKGKPSALLTAMEDEMSDSELDLGKALYNADLTKIDAAKLGVEREGLWASDETINKVMEEQGKRARRDAERDANVDMSRRAQIDDLRGKPWDAAKWKEERTATSKRIEEDTKRLALQNMANLETAYDSKFGKGGMVVLIAFNMMGEDQDKAWELRANGGILPPESEIYYAVNGPGTDLDKLKEVLKGKSPAEIQKIREAWDAKHGKGTFDARILEEVSGRDEQDMKWALKGEPQTLDEKIQRAKERRDYEHNDYGWVGSQDAEKAVLDSQYNSLVKEAEELKALEAQTIPGGDADLEKLRAPQGEKESDKDYAARVERLDKLEYYKERFKVREGYFDTTVEDHRKAIDSFADTAATIAAIVATVIVIVVAAVLTGGTAGAAIAAALASAKVAAIAALAAATATIGTKYAIKGGAYSKQEMAIDAVVGAVDAVVSVATAGVGGGLLKAARAGAPASKLATWAAKTRLASGLSKMAKSERLVARVFAGAVSEGIEGVASTLPSALAGNVLDEKNWSKGNPLANILQGTVVQTGMAVALSGGMGGLGGIGKHVPEGPLTRETGDILAKRGNPADRLAAWKAWKVDNPGVPFKQFSEQFDAGIIAKDVDDAARHALQREMRGELLSGIPPAQRKQFAGVPVEVISDADFAGFTKSASGQAVVIFKDGKPLVLLRETADIKALREEGIHLLQSKDPKLRKQFKALDEANLARWNKMGLDEQLSLYKTKIDIELDAQTKLIKQLDDQLAALDDPALRKTLLAQRKAAGETLENLGRRLDELGEISPLDRLKMTRGEVPKPQYLDQEPRLFAKSKGLTGDPELMAAMTRMATSRASRDVVADLIDDAVSKSLFKSIFQNFDSRARSFFAKTNKALKKSKESFTAFLAGSSKGARFDGSVVMKSFVSAIEELVGKGDKLQLRQALESIRTLIDNVRISAAHLEPFLGLSTRVKRPGRLFALVEEMAELVSFRRKSLPKLADAIEAVAAKKPKLVEEFVEKIEELSALAKKRDRFEKGTTAWIAAQDKLVSAAEALQKQKKFAVPKGKLDPILEEFSRTGQFNWDVFKETLSEKYPLDKHAFAEMKKMVTDLRKGLKASWSETNVGPILHWSKIVEELPPPKRKILLAELKGYLTDELTEEMTQAVYKGYRHKIRDAMMDHIMEPAAAAARVKGLTDFMEFLRKSKTDPATIGEYFAEFRRRVFKGGGHAIQGDLRGLTNAPIRNRNLPGSKRMVDGALDVPADHKLPKGRYLVEDKAGDSFDLAQAKNYSDRLKKGTLATADSGPTKGLIYIAEDPVHARKIASELALNGLDSRIIVATLDPTSKSLKIVPRPGKATPTPAAGKPKKGKK